MASELKKLFDPVQLTTSAARLGSYSVPAGKRLDGFELLLSNINSAERGVDIYLGSSASAATQLYSKRENGLRIAGKTPLVVPSRQVLAAGDGIWAAASDPLSISVHASGVEVDEEGALPTRIPPPEAAFDRHDHDLYGARGQAVLQLRAGGPERLDGGGDFHELSGPVRVEPRRSEPAELRARDRAR